MKRFLLLIFVTLSIQAMSQPGKPPKKVILFENHEAFVIFRIGEGQQMSLILKSGEEVKGPIRRISGDTIEIGGTTLLASDIAEIRKTVSGGPPFRPSKNRLDSWYRVNTNMWKIVCPPPEVYKNGWSFQSYLSSRERNLQKEKNAIYYPLISKNFLKFNLIKLAHLEIALSYERVITPKVSWETEISVIFGIQGADAHYQFNYPLYNYNGFSLTTNPKYYFGHSGFYVGTVFMYRYLWFDQVRTAWPGESAAGDLQDQVRNDFGGSFRIGIMRRYGQAVVDWYVGGGIKVIMVHQLVYADYRYADNDQMHWRHEDHSPDVYDQTLLGPVINAGIKIGFGF